MSACVARQIVEEDAVGHVDVDCRRVIFRHVVELRTAGVVRRGVGRQIAVSGVPAIDCRTIESGLLRDSSTS